VVEDSEESLSPRTSTSWIGRGFGRFGEKAAVVCKDMSFEASMLLPVRRVGGGSRKASNGLLGSDGVSGSKAAVVGEQAGVSTEKCSEALLYTTGVIEK